MDVIRNETLQDRRLPLDGKSFVNCSLVGCVLEYSGGPVNFEHTVFRSCKYVFFGPARATVHFMQAIGLANDEADMWAEFPDRVQ